MIGPCAKRRVVATLVGPNGDTFTAENLCGNAQPVCPRLPGEGYEKCQTICRQGWHAEAKAMTDAFARIGPGIHGSVCYVHHHYGCAACEALAAQHGVRLVFTAPADSERTPA